MVADSGHCTLSGKDISHIRPRPCRNEKEKPADRNDKRVGGTLQRRKTGNVNETSFVSQAGCPSLLGGDGEMGDSQDGDR
jgi:hypothetical protein